MDVASNQLHWDRQGDDLILQFGPKTLCWIKSVTPGCITLHWPDGTVETFTRFDFAKGTAERIALHKLNGKKRKVSGG